MRQLIVRVPQGCGLQVMEIAERHQGTNLASFEASDGKRPVDVILVHVPNAEIETILGDLQGLPDLHVTFAPYGVISLHPPAEEAAEQIIDVDPRSPIEIFLGGLQSVGSWKGFLGYAFAAGIVVWIGLFTNTVYLLTAAMLIAPFAGPAMNASLATARGDAPLFFRSLARYFSALAITIAVAWSLSMIMGQEIATDQMVATSTISSIAVFLPLVAGAAGALNLCQSDRNSLVSGAATGMLVAASLAPPAGTLGMAMAIGEWDIAKSGVFVLLLQLAGINVSGAIIFRLFGLSPEGVRYPRGRAAAGVATWLGSLAALVALLGWQWFDPPSLQRSTQAQRAAAVAQDIINDSGKAKPVSVEVTFTRADIQGQNTMLVRAYVQASSSEDDQSIKRSIATTIQENLKRRFNVTPLADITVLRTE